MKLISCLQINVKCFLGLILSFQVCVARHAQIIQNKNVSQCLYNISKKKLDEVDFLHVDKHQNFIQIDFNTFGHQSFLQGNTIIITKSSSAAGRTRHRLGSTRTCPYYAFRHIAKSSSAAGDTRHRLGNTSTCPYYAFRHITKSSSASGCTRLCYMSKRVIQTSACVAKPMSSASCS